MYGPTTEGKFTSLESADLVRFIKKFPHFYRYSFLRVLARSPKRKQTLVANIIGFFFSFRVQNTSVLHFARNNRMKHFTSVHYLFSVFPTKNGEITAHVTAYAQCICSCFSEMTEPIWTNLGSFESSRDAIDQV